MKTIWAITLFVSLICGAAPARAQSPDFTPPRITALMSARELEAAGLASLTSAQLDALSTWVQQYRQSAEWLAVTAAQGEDMLAPENEVIESAIEGDFDGWVGDTVFRLKNGQIWQQTSRSAKYLFAHAPKVTISRAPFRLRVEGLGGEVAVRRLR